MSTGDDFTHFLLSMGNLSDNELQTNDPQGALFKVLHFCQGLKKTLISLENTVEDLRKENNSLHAQVDKLKVEFSDRVEAMVEQKTSALHARLAAVEKGTAATKSLLEDKATTSEVEKSIASSQKDVVSRLETALDDRMAQVPEKAEVTKISENVEDLEGRFGQVSERLNEWSAYRKLQEDIEIGSEPTEEENSHPSPRNPFSLLHLLHPSKSTPLTWTISNFSTFTRLAKKNAHRRLYSQPFGIEKENTVRCVLRAVVVVLNKPEGDVIQFALEVLFATKYKRKFDFRFQIVGNKPIVKTFSSTEAVVPRYWFPQNELQPSGLISFAFGVDEAQLRKDELIVDDKLVIVVGLRE